MVPYSQGGLNDFNNLFAMCVTSVNKISIAAWLPMASDVCVQKSDIGRGLQTTCELCKTTTKQGPEWDFKIPLWIRNTSHD